MLGKSVSAVIFENIDCIDEEYTKDSPKASTKSIVRHIFSTLFCPLRSICGPCGPQLVPTTKIVY